MLKGIDANKWLLNRVYKIHNTAYIAEEKGRNY